LLFGIVIKNCKDNLKIVIANDVDYESLIAETSRNDEFIALLQQEDSVNDVKVEFSDNISPIDFNWLQNKLI